MAAALKTNVVLKPPPYMLNPPRIPPSSVASRIIPFAPSFFPSPTTWRIALRTLFHHPGPILGTSIRFVGPSATYLVQTPSACHRESHTLYALRHPRLDK